MQKKKKKNVHFVHQKVHQPLENFMFRQFVANFVDFRCNNSIVMKKKIYIESVD